MRYTTIIDISELHSLYKNKNAVLLYLHLCLVSGYHKDDRDIARRSIRTLCSDLGLTLSACRYGLAVLRNAGLLQVLDDGAFLVKKFIEPEDIPKRRAKKIDKEDENYRHRMEEQARLDDKLRKIKEDREAGRTGPVAFLSYLEGKAASGDIKAKKEAEDLRLQLRKQGVI